MLLKKDLTILQKNRIIDHLPYLIDLYKKIQFSYYVNSPDYIEMENIPCLNFDVAVNMYMYYDTKYPRLWNLVSKIVVSNYKKRQRVSKRFENMFDNATSPIYFGTLTFTNEVLDNTSLKTRRVYVSRFLKNISFNYLANIDFGDLNNREHYHCIFECSHIDDFKKWKYGFVNVKKVRYSDKDIKRVSKYVVKLINHCVKGSAGFLVASRNKKK